MSRPRFFASLPNEVNHLIISKLGYKDLNAVKAANRGGRDGVIFFRNTAHPIEVLADAPRKAVQMYLNHYFKEVSQSYKELAQVVEQAEPHPYDYALYALIADINKLDKVKLRASIDFLMNDDRMTSIVTSLNIIDCYLAEQNNAEHMQSLRYLLERSEGAYINLRNCRLEGDFTNLNLSYANLRFATLLFNASGSDFRGADCANIMIGGATRLEDINFEGINVENAVIGDRIMEWEADMDVPGAIEVNDDPLIAQIFTNRLRQEMNDAPRPFPSCNIL